ncbi:class I SAM-dependent DNA methyltransferase [Waterburya agarophytonicola K14]|uniref:site-specific DNA-methyltransferase (adenine-specific) n=1 Tax=Waterburya agarophytonicola KI4 TaxID=2874699 RepID=A0A964BQ98_9CYAN|nr:DNA methyltransferase [Waterburya agarophytonicola]MCC0176826.1 class I SAM-dependent DNA methyltransferase [Waterburya agarophytonicola KI4]
MIVSSRLVDVTSRSQNLQAFVNFCQQYISGKERSEAQKFLDRFFQAFGHEGAIEAGAELEKAIAKGSKKGKTGFADLVWKPRVLIEMKTKGEDLAKHYRQAFNYWTRLVPDRPQYVILCNFDEFWIYDFNSQVDEPVDIVALEDLPKRVAVFGFMEIEDKTPIFNNNQVEITKETARKMGELYEIIEQRGKKEGFKDYVARRLILQCVLSMFAEDRGLLPDNIFTRCVDECLNGKSSYDLLGGLFDAMNRPGIIPAGRYKGVDYFNGGLFATIHHVELTQEELTLLATAAKEDWTTIRPAIFGSIFEGTASNKQRHRHGIHFTSEVDIMKIVRPTISNYWDEKIEVANSIAELSALQLELSNYRVFDPACGSGNFLYLAYQELKEIEKDLLDKIASRRRSETSKQQVQMGLVTPLQFYGMDINPFAVELAKVTLTIAKKVAIDKLGLTEQELPLDTLDQNIVCDDALFSPWVKADAIIGNPPFLGGKRLKQELGEEYTEKVYKQFFDVKGQPDFCTYWFRLAEDNLEQNGRAGLVGTNSIAQNTSREASLDYLTDNGSYIHDAISSQVWSGDANVHVSIVNWSKQKPEKLFLDNLPVERISTSLKNEIAVNKAKKIKANKNYSFEGCKLIGKGFIISKHEAQQWTQESSKNAEVLKPMIDGKSLVNLHLPMDWIIDFNNMSIEEAFSYKKPLERVKNTVKIERENKKNKKLKEKWWLFERSRPAMRKALTGLSCYFAIPKVTKYTVFSPIDISILPCEANMVIASDDYYILGIINSHIHRLWVKAQSSTLKGDTRYTNTTCFETFPFPQNHSRGERRFADTDNVVQQIRDKMTELHEYRTQQMEQKQWGITQLYNQYFHEPASKLYQLHQQLDKLVLQAYGFKTNDDILAKLLELNLELVAKEKRGEPVIGAESPID